MSEIQKFNMLGGIPPDPVYHCADDSLEDARMVEEYADSLMDRCKAFKRADALNTEHDIYDGATLPSMMVEIANWTGSSEDAVKRMKALFNILANELQRIAQKECE